MEDKEIIEKIKVLIDEGSKLKMHLSSAPVGNYTVEEANQKYYQEASRWKLKCLNLLKLRFGTKSDYYESFYLAIKEGRRGAGEFYKENVGKSLGIIEGVLDALESRLTEDLFYQREVMLFSNLLEQAYEFFNKGLIEAAAIYGRIVLEMTIKEFAAKNNIQEKSFDQIIIKLRQADIIHQPLENSLRANYQIGSDATHNNTKFQKYTNNEIKEFLNFIRDRVLVLE